MPTDDDEYPKVQRMYPKAEPGRAQAPERAPTAPPCFPPAFEAELFRLAPSRVTVLLVGGSRLLKHAVAAALHERSPRAMNPFIAFDCAGRDADAIELSLFGGPVYAALEPGAIRQAEAGTLYLATVDDLPLLMQPRFLRFLDQERTVRVIASANQDLLTRVREGRFRLDLAERLTLVELFLPALADWV